MGSPKTKVQRNQSGRPRAGFSQKGRERGSVQSYHWGTYGDSYEASLRGMVPFPLGSRDASSIRDCPLSTAPPGKTSASEIRPTKGRNVRTRPWLVMTSDREGEAGSRGKRVCYLKSVNPQVSSGDPGTALK